VAESAVIATEKLAMDKTGHNIKENLLEENVLKVKMILLSYR